MAGRTCTVCAHPEREAIDRALVVGQESFRLIASRHSLVDTSLRRHKTEHLPDALTKAKDAQDVAQGDDLLAEARKLQTRTHAILARAWQANDLRTALGAIRESRGNLELLAKLLGKLDERAQINVLLSPQWIQVRAVLLGALAPYPEARAAVAAGLRQLEGGHAGS